MPTFVHPALLWGLLLVAVPPLIHLINLLRHRRVEWAAMEFLLLSQKRNRTRVILRELLLLLLRMAAIAAVVFMLAQPLLRSRFGEFLGGVNTHHIFLVDDSYSMSDRTGPRSAFDEAVRVVESIANEAQKQTSPQEVSILPFSGEDADSRWLRRPVDSEFADLLKERLSKWSPSDTAAGPAAVLKRLDEFLADDPDAEDRVLYLVSDFRAKDWDEADEIRAQLAALQERGMRIHFVRCVDRARPNLAVTDLKALGGFPAAGVPFVAEATIHNFSPAAVERVTLLPEVEGRALPAVTIARIPAGGSIKERFFAQFAEAGMQRLAVKLDSDAVAVDNLREVIIDVVSEIPLLIIDGAAEATDGKYLAAALAPGGAARTGFAPRIEPPRYLSTEPLDAYAVVYLANVPFLDESAIRKLENHVAEGGGLAIFLGEKSQRQFLNEGLYRDGKGLLPVPIERAEDLPPLIDATVPDVNVAEHPIFRVFEGGRNDFISMVAIDRYFATPPEWVPPADSTVAIAASLRNDRPLVVEKTFGNGRVVAFLTTAAPTWNNWARSNPSFVVVVHEMQNYLSRDDRAFSSRLVGEPLVVDLDPAVYDPLVRFRPSGTDRAPEAVQAEIQSNGMLRATLENLKRRGIYEVELARKDNQPEIRRFAVNPDTSEGDLEAADGEFLAKRLEGVRFDCTQAEAFQYAEEQKAGVNLGRMLLYGIILLLLGEQTLAYSASYHPPAKQRRAS